MGRIPGTNPTYIEEKLLSNRFYVCDSPLTRLSKVGGNMFPIERLPEIPGAEDREG
jgi:hypothetical protein